MNAPQRPQLFVEQSAVVALVNREAGSGRAGRQVEQIQKLLTVAGVPTQFLFPRRPAELQESARQAVTKGATALIAIGGDGTFQCLANATYGCAVTLGVIPAGGGNDFAAALGFSSNPLRAARELLKSEGREVDLVRVQTSDGVQRLYCGGGGLGLDALAASYANGPYRRLRGRSRYLLSVLRAYREQKAFSLRLEFPETSQAACQRRVMLAAVLNTPSYGAGLRLAPLAKIDDGSLELVLIGPTGIFGLLRILLRLIIGRAVKTSDADVRSIQRARFVTKPAVMMHGDGEIFGSTPVLLEVIPKAIRVFSPKPPAVE